MWFSEISRLTSQVHFKLTSRELNLFYALAICFRLLSKSNIKTHLNEQNMIQFKTLFPSSPYKFIVSKSTATEIGSHIEVPHINFVINSATHSALHIQALYFCWAGVKRILFELSISCTNLKTMYL